MRDDYVPKVGEWVRIRQYEDMLEEFGINEMGSIKCRCLFTSGMRVLCGREFLITSLNDGVVSGLDTDWTISTDMIEPAVEDNTDEIDFTDINEFLDGFKK